MLKERFVVVVEGVGDKWIGMLTVLFWYFCLMFML